jgi:hypothetical protein
MLVYKAGDRVRLVSRNGRDHTHRFADMASAIGKLSPRMLVAMAGRRLRSTNSPEVPFSWHQRVMAALLSARVSVIEEQAFPPPERVSQPVLADVKEATADRESRYQR